MYVLTYIFFVYIIYYFVICVHVYEYVFVCDCFNEVGVIVFNKFNSFFEIANCECVEIIQYSIDIRRC